MTLTRTVVIVMTTTFFRGSFAANVGSLWVLWGLLSLKHAGSDTGYWQLDGGCGVGCTESMPLPVVVLYSYHLAA